MIPPLASSACGRTPDRAEAGALDDRVELHVEFGGIPGVVATAERLDKVTLWSRDRQVDDVHFVAALDPEQASHQPDRPGARDQRTAPLEERALGDSVHLIPGLGQHGRRL